MASLGCSAERYFYPRSPCGERQTLAVGIPKIYAFLSTLSLRRATSAEPVRNSRKEYFYPRSPCGERRYCKRLLGQVSGNFYPRSPCGERPQWRTLASGMYGFLSTLSLRRATWLRSALWLSPGISIHALLAESDCSASRYLSMPS